jgi:hypothetical protein
MTVTFTAIYAPIAATLLAIAWAFIMPLPARRGDYDFGAEISAMFRLVVVVIVTLLAWLIYFALT